jgi:cytochrome c oxidase subunit 2
VLKRITGLVVLVALATTGCDNVATRGGWPKPITEQGEKVLGVWRGSMITAACVGVFVIGLILWSCFAFRRRSDDQMPRQVRYNLPIEVLYTVVPVNIPSWCCRWGSRCGSTRPRPTSSTRSG